MGRGDNGAAGEGSEWRVWLGGQHGGWRCGAGWGGARRGGTGAAGKGVSLFFCEDHKMLESLVQSVDESGRCNMHSALVAMGFEQHPIVRSSRGFVSHCDAVKVVYRLDSVSQLHLDEDDRGMMVDTDKRRAKIAKRARKARAVHDLAQHAPAGTPLARLRAALVRAHQKEVSSIHEVCSNVHFLTWPNIQNKTYSLASWLCLYIYSVACV